MFSGPKTGLDVRIRYRKHPAIFNFDFSKFNRKLFMAPQLNRSKNQKVAHSDSAATAQIVADRVGVSLMTVSRALNGTKGVSKKTREKILKVAQELGYSPNNAAAALRRGSSNTIALLLDSSLGVRGEYHSDSLAGFEQVVSEAGYDLLLMVPKPDEGIPGLITRLVNSTRCDAVVLRFDILRTEELQLLSDLDAPLVLASHVPEDVANKGIHKFSSASFDNVDGVSRAVRHLVTLGHQNIAYLGGTKGWVDAEDREKGFRHEMKARGLEIKDEWIVDCRFEDGVGSGNEGLATVLSAAVPGPTGVVCASDKIAAGAMMCARKWGLNIPEDISIVGFDNDSWGEFSSPPLTTVKQDGFEFGKCLGKLVLEEIKNPEAPGRHVSLQTPIVVRDSTAPPKESKTQQPKGKSRA